MGGGGRPAVGAWSGDGDRGGVDWQARIDIEWNGAVRRPVGAEAASLCVWMWGVICPVLIRWVPYPDGWGWRVRCQVGTTEPAQFLELVRYGKVTSTIPGKASLPVKCTRQLHFRGEM